MTCHAIQRAWERYGIGISPWLGNEIDGWIRRSDFRTVLLESNPKVSYYGVLIDGRWLAAVFANDRVITFLPRKWLVNRRAILRARGRQLGVPAEPLSQQKAEATP